MVILAIETSCDETSAAVLKDRAILSNIVFSQSRIHAKFGGIVPEVAARKHIEIIIPVISQALLRAKIKKQEIDAIAVTCGPGLITSLMIGIDTAKSLAFVLKKPLIAVNHLEGHIYANFIGNKSNTCKGVGNDKLSEAKFVINNEIRFAHFVTPIFPLLSLIASGGHTELVYMPRHLKYKLIGETRDDAVGECFDKVAKLLNIGYPGGPVISRLAEKGNLLAYNFPRPMINSGDFDFSFSGLKTDVLRLVKNRMQQNGDSYHKVTVTFGNSHQLFSSRDLCNICASFQAAVCDVLISKTIAAAKKYKPKTIALAGGVAANKFLRKKMAQEIKKQIPNTKYLIPSPKYCCDNAAMIAVAAYFK
ncbi:MAG: tRNA (adenosine(37)-N6)-threonylcarbamoyltransferase complex dimerization subunit type 1 TsaB, partial [Patescibacteria group bacterium]